MVSGSAGGRAQPAEGAGEEARAEVLERRGRPVKELEDRQPPIIGERYQRGREVERLARQCRQLRVERIVGEERGQQALGHRGQLARPGEVFGAELRPVPGDIEPAVTRQSLEQRRAEALVRGAAARAVKEDVAHGAHGTTRAPTAFTSTHQASERS